MKKSILSAIFFFLLTINLSSQQRSEIDSKEKLNESNKIFGAEYSGFLHLSNIQSINFPVTLFDTSGYFQGSKIGVFGYSSASSGETFGVRGTSNSTSGYGVYGESNGPVGITYGAYGKSISPEGFGVYGINTSSSGNGVGVYGKTQSTSGQGVRGVASSETGATYGVYGISSSNAGYGVYGRADNGVGAYFRGSKFKADIILGAFTGGSDADDDGIISSDPIDSDGDIFLHSMDAIVAHLDYDDSGNDADFVVRDGPDIDIFNIDDSGDVTGTHGNYHVASDIRLKRSITEISGALDKIKKLRGVNYHWKDSERDQSLRIGLIAQEVEQVVPEVVHTASDQMQTKSVEYQYLVALLIEALKDQQSLVDELTKRVEVLEKEEIFK